MEVVKWNFLKKYIEQWFKTNIQQWKKKSLGLGPNSFGKRWEKL